MRRNKRSWEANIAAKAEKPQEEPSCRTRQKGARSIGGKEGTCRLKEQTRACPLPRKSKGRGKIFLTARKVSAQNDEGQVRKRGGIDRGAANAGIRFFGGGKPRGGNGSERTRKRQAIQNKVPAAERLSKMRTKQHSIEGGGFSLGRGGEGALLEADQVRGKDLKRGDTARERSYVEERRNEVRAWARKSKLGEEEKEIRKKSGGLNTRRIESLLAASYTASIDHKLQTEEEKGDRRR